VASVTVPPLFEHGTSLPSAGTKGQTSAAFSFPRPSPFPQLQTGTDKTRTSIPHDQRAIDILLIDSDNSISFSFLQSKKKMVPEKCKRRKFFSLHPGLSDLPIRPSPLSWLAFP
jgi:hypothetical protein